MKLKMQLWIFVGLILLTMMMSTSATAQEDAQPCTTAQLNHGANPMHEPIAKPINDMSTTARPGNMSIYLELANRVWGTLHDVKVVCLGMHFTSTSQAATHLVGPITFSKGNWRAIFTTEQYGIVIFSVPSGTCDPSFILFNVSRAEARKGTERVFNIPGECEAVISIENTSGQWDLKFEPIKLTDE